MGLVTSGIVIHLDEERNGSRHPSQYPNRLVAKISWPRRLKCLHLLFYVYIPQDLFTL